MRHEGELLWGKFFRGAGKGENLLGFHNRGKERKGTTIFSEDPAVL